MTGAAFGASPQDYENNTGLSNKDNKMISTIDTIQDAGVKEKIIDLLSLCYVEVVVEDGRANPIVVSEEEIISVIKDLSLMSEAQLKDKIEETIRMVQEKSNVILLPSSYEVMAKYSYDEEIAIIKNIKKKAFSSSSSFISKPSVSKTPSMSWEKSGTGYLQSPIVGVTAYYTITIQWWTNSNDQIYYYDDYHGGGSNQIYYEYIRHNVVSEGIPSEYNGQRAHVYGKALYKKAGITWNPNDYIHLDVWFYNDGALDAIYWTD